MRFFRPLALELVKCADCVTTVNRQCVGLHAVYQVQCHTPRIFDCKRQCGNPLACGNHVCELPCHIVTTARDSRKFILDENDVTNPDGFKDFEQSVFIGLDKTEVFRGVSSLGSLLDIVQSRGRDTCFSCKLQCQRKRVPFCKHPCKLRCHPGEYLLSRKNWKFLPDY
jgi:NF-X1-type zinc finger protein NFXL1